MKKLILASLISLLLILMLSNTVSAVRFDVEQAMQEEWER